jgi:hypothetical protein
MRSLSHGPRHVRVTSFPQGSVLSIDLNVKFQVEHRQSLAEYPNRSTRAEAMAASPAWVRGPVQRGASGIS